jgi:hypothetical protein
MNQTADLNNLTVEELDLIHSALIHRRRTLPDLINAWGINSARGRELRREMDMLPALSEKVCEVLVDATLGRRV